MLKNKLENQNSHKKEKLLQENLEAICTTKGYISTYKIQFAPTYKI